MKYKIFSRCSYGLFLCLAILTICFLFPSYIFASSKVSLSMETVTAQPGSEVSIPIKISENSGIASLKMLVKFDSTKLTLTDVNFPKNTGTYSSVPEPYSGNQIINFVSPLASFNKTGTFLTLTFLVSEDADSNNMQSISIEFEEDDIFDMDFNNVPLMVFNGGIYISDVNEESAVKLPAALTEIEDEAFMNTFFYSVDLPETVTSIGSKAFANCSNLKHIYIPENTTRIAKDAFMNVTNLVIWGKNGSYAEFFANSNGFEFRTK